MDIAEASNIPMVTELLVENLDRLEAGEGLHNEIDRERGY